MLTGIERANLEKKCIKEGIDVQEIDSSLTYWENLNHLNGISMGEIEYQEDLDEEITLNNKKLEWKEWTKTWKDNHEVPEEDDVGEIYEKLCDGFNYVEKKEIGHVKGDWLIKHMIDSLIKS